MMIYYRTNIENTQKPTGQNDFTKKDMEPMEFHQLTKTGTFTSFNKENMLTS